MSGTSRAGALRETTPKVHVKSEADLRRVLDCSRAWSFGRTSCLRNISIARSEPKASKEAVKPSINLEKR